jgi:hypothetical protein
MLFEIGEGGSCADVPAKIISLQLLSDKSDCIRNLSIDFRPGSLIYPISDPCEVYK